MTNPPQSVYSLDSLDGDPAPVLEALRNRAADQARVDSRSGTVWWLDDVSPDHDRCLIVGVRGEVGVLVWDDEDTGSCIPEHGLNTTDVDYFTVTGDHYPQQPGREVPVDQVIEAAREFVATRRRPSNIRWISDTRPRG